MNILKLAFCSLLFMSCSGQTKLKTEIILSTFRTECQTSENGSISRVRRTIPEKAVWKHQITKQSATENTISYKIQGSIKTGGHTIRRIKNLKSEEAVSGDTLIIKHTVTIVTIPGKEGANVYAQNYQQEFSKKRDDKTNYLKIELYEEREKTDTNPRLMASELFSF